ncbi:MAG: ATP-binding protein [Desulfurococcaceae archaeon TW002]
MLFDPRPKTRVKDLYDFENELNTLKKYLGEPLIVVTGLRRTGKTSLILTALNESGFPYVFFDLRTIMRSRKELYQLISAGFSEFLSRISRSEKLYRTLLRFLKFIRGVSVSGFTIEFSWGSEKPLLSEVFTALNEVGIEHDTKIIVVFDELQKALGHASVILQNTIAHAYDYLRNLSFVISGSEMGVLYRFFGDPRTPLYGRAYLEVKTRRLTKEESINYLIKGFEEAGRKVELREIEEVVDKLDGIIGWLTYYGYAKIMQNKNLELIWREAVELAKQELEDFLKYRVGRERYRTVLKLLAQDLRDWGRLKRKLEDLEGRAISDRVLHDILHTLRKHTIINEQNKFLDPLVEEAAKNL